MGDTSVLGLPELYMYKCYFKPIIRRRKCSEATFEAWLEKHGLHVYGDGVDERGDYLLVGTEDKALAERIAQELLA